MHFYTPETANIVMRSTVQAALNAFNDLLSTTTAGKCFYILIEPYTDNPQPVVCVTTRYYCF